MKRKRAMALLLAGSMVMGLAACSSSEPSSESTGGSASNSSGAQDSSTAQTESGGAESSGETPVLRLATYLHTEQTVALEDLWFFKHLEKKFNVKFELEDMGADSATRVNQFFLADDLPDIMWLGLSTTDAMTYGVSEGMLLDWTPYMNEETMPNLMNVLKDYPDALVASTTPDGKVYSLPYIRGPVYANNTGAFSGTIRVNINKVWLDKVNMDMPATLDEFVEVARAFKQQDPGGVGEQLIPVSDNQNKIKDYIWNALGFYGSGQTYGTNFAIKNNQITLPAYTPEAKEFMQTLNTMLKEGLLSPDYFTLDQDTNRANVAAGYVGIFGDSTLQPAENSWQDWLALSPLSSDVNDTRVAHVNAGYSLGTYVSSRTEYPELIASIIDYMYSDEGGCYYHNGPMKGSADEMDGNGWWIKEDGSFTNARMEADPVATLANGNTACYYVAGRFDHMEAYRYDLAGVDNPMEYRTVRDVLTGKEVEMPVTDVSIFDDDNWDHHWRVIQTEAMKDYLTFIVLPPVYLSLEQKEEADNYATVINDYVTQETAKFIAGERPLDEFDAYQNELKDLGVEDYINIYKDAYSGFIDATFGN
ncbi:extracellular solute-binding protein [Acetatifactor muris]|uniref:Lipoprotein LipO n=1 Tax=Acetatifactor muris TaxID=879566 RepID=A0A2K4ZI96_9FIRM|nr:extracellular solute-binding protein [Acetatifactor muris]MCR2048395.1 extracellular solute-binding protein [Acetatifactor muris]SOY30199.1 Lipoprotein LipO precursor [Acetatifactor muris]